MTLAVGIDVGTSGVRAVAMDAAGAVVAEAATPMAAHGSDPRDPATWWAATTTALAGLLAAVDPGRVRAVAVDGTSGTVLPVDAAGTPLATPLMYNDPVDDAGLLARIAAEAPPTSAAHGPTSGLAKAMRFRAVPGVARILHQADWIAGRLAGRFGTSDANNALKTGYDPVAGRWPDWIERVGLDPALLPRVVVPGTPLGGLSDEMAERFGLRRDAEIVAGTTDGCASFLATGASRPGEGVSALGSSLTIKLLSDRPIFAPEFGIYSHRLGDTWLAGGASNTGGKVLAAFFTPDALATLSATIDPEVPSGLDYYPLLRPGERFPVADPALPPRLDPRPDDDADFLKGLLDGIAAIEALAYRRLAELGGPDLMSVRTVGGGAKNPVWSRMRALRLGVPLAEARSEEAAAGTARLAWAGARAAGLAA